MVLPDTEREHLRQFGPYVGHEHEVEHPFHGRGVLIGLPCAHINDEQPLATVRFHKKDVSYFPDYYNLSDCKLVLYAAEDAEAIARAVPSSQRTGATFMLTDYGPEELHKLARMIDHARALGIALNLPEGSYVRRELQCGNTGK